MTQGTSATRARPEGVGLGLRWDFLDELLEATPALPFLEVSPENYMGRGGYYDEALDRATARYPILSHGLTMSIGGVDPLDEGYLSGLREFIARAKSPWHSDHLCFGSYGGRILHDLLPVPFLESEVSRIADRVKRAQDAVGVPMAIENVSFYLHPGAKEMGEAEFIARVCDAADCKLMLDVNNAWVNATNFGFDVDEWMATVPLDRVVQMHIAGHDWFSDGTWEIGARPARIDGEHGMLIVDTHGADVCAEVRALLERVLARTGPKPVLLERDQSIPPLDALLGEVRELQEVYDRGVDAWRTRDARRLA
jgi:uncharacterized protein